MTFVVSTVIRIQRIIDSVFRQFRMQLTAITVHIFTVVIVNTIRDVAGLLDLSNKTTRSDRMHTSRRQEEYIAFIYVVTLKHIHDRIVLHTFHIFLSVDLLRETGIQASAFLCLDHIPHLRLTERVVAFFRQLIVRVNLNG